MGSPVVLIVMLFALGTFAVILFLITHGAESRTLSRREHEELRRLRALVDDLKDTAWDHRELDSALSVIMIDKIREYERRNRELGP